MGKQNLRRQLSQGDVQALMQLLKSGKVREAVVQTKKLIKTFPNAPILLDVLSKGQIAENDFAGAAETLEKLLAIKPDFIDGIYNLALVYVNLDRPGDAIPKFETVIEKTGGSADVFTNLGAAYFGLEQFENAANAYKKAVEKDPKFVPALRNLGTALRSLKRYDESITYLEKVPLLAPRFANGHLSLGVSYARAGKTDKAKACFETTLKLQPENVEAWYELGVLHTEDKNYDEAIAAFSKVDTPEARVKVLVQMHEKGDASDEVRSKLEQMNSDEPKNLHLAAFSAFASDQFGIENSHPFAPSPLDLVSKRRLIDDPDETRSYLTELMAEAGEVGAVWENNTTRGGFQTHGNLFKCGPALERLEGLIRQHLKAYRDEHEEYEAGLFSQFPEAYDLHGWHVKLLKSGFQKPHIHPRGWVSGVVYLKIPAGTKGNEGGIAFSLHGYDYRKDKDDIPTLEHLPEAGDIVLFPSSLFHSTIPFEADEDRQCIAFDVLPV